MFGRIVSKWPRQIKISPSILIYTNENHNHILAIYLNANHESYVYYDLILIDPNHEEYVNYDLI